MHVSKTAVRKMMLVQWRTCVSLLLLSLLLLLLLPLLLLLLLQVARFVRPSPLLSTMRCWPQWWLRWRRCLACLTGAALAAAQA
jgi:hypothetical protein